MDKLSEQQRKNMIFDGDEYRREALKAAAVLLSYPEGSNSEILHEVCDWARGLMPAAQRFKTAAEALLDADRGSLRSLYVESFDFDPKTSLFLTSHEYGESRERGTALIQLLRMLARGGFVPANGELADSVPVLLEFLAVKPADLDTTELEVRLSALCGRLEQCLGGGHVYQRVFTAIRDVLPAVTQEQIDRLDEAGHSADSEEDMPYPVYYGSEIEHGMGETEGFGLFPEENLGQPGKAAEMKGTRREPLWRNSGG